MKSFKQHTIDDMTYGNATEKDKKRISAVSDMFSIRADEIDLTEPSANSSAETMKELLEIKKIAENADMSDYKKYDKSFTDKFHELAEEFELGTSLENLKSISEEVGGFVHYFKFKFNRPRPHQLAEVLGVEINHQGTISGNTPAYPSGHAAQARFLALHLSERFPTYKEEFMKLADTVAYSRIQGGVHYPSDSTTGKKLADILFENYNEEQ